MSTTPKLLLAVIATSTLLLGCSTPQHGGSWEYKTLVVYNTPDAELNKVATDGWTVVGLTQVENRYTILLKKKK